MNEIIDANSEPIQKEKVMNDDKASEDGSFDVEV